MAPPLGTRVSEECGPLQTCLPGQIIASGSPTALGLQSTCIAKGITSFWKDPVKGKAELPWTKPGHMSSSALAMAKRRLPSGSLPGV